jgi:WD40 repeat protein
MKGDMYVHDMAQTKGHVAALCGACWHPTDRNTCLTGSLDGTVRLWDVNECTKKQVTVIKTKNEGQKATPSAVCYTCKGDIVAACDDGTIKIYNGRAVAKVSTQRAHNELKTAHQPGTNTTSVTVSRRFQRLSGMGRISDVPHWTKSAGTIPP